MASNNIMSRTVEPDTGIALIPNDSLGAMSNEFNNILFILSMHNISLYLLTLIFCSEKKILAPEEEDLIDSIDPEIYKILEIKAANVFAEVAQKYPIETIQFLAFRNIVEENVDDMRMDELFILVFIEDKEARLDFIDDIYGSLKYPF